MADAPTLPDEAATRACWGGFAWTPENAEEAREIVGRLLMLENRPIRRGGQ